jgi:hypothetical protein
VGRLAARGVQLSASILFEEVDLRVLVLLRELAELDALDPKDAKRASLLRSALENVTELEKLGGGSLGAQKVEAIVQALTAALAEVG